jgi:hypothetical protein
LVYVHYKGLFGQGFQGMLERGNVGKRRMSLRAMADKDTNKAYALFGAGAKTDRALI